MQSAPRGTVAPTAPMRAHSLVPPSTPSLLQTTPQAPRVLNPLDSQSMVGTTAERTVTRHLPHCGSRLISHPQGMLVNWSQTPPQPSATISSSSSVTKCEGVTTASQSLSGHRVTRVRFCSIGLNIKVCSKKNHYSTDCVILKCDWQQVVRWPVEKGSNRTVINSYVNPVHIQGSLLSFRTLSSK